MRLPSLTFVLALLCATVRTATGIILVDTGDSTRNTSTPGDNSGWQYEGSFGGFLGTPIAPFYFVTAKHINGQIGQAFTFHGETFTTTAVYPDPLTDLQIWQVDHAFACYAPLYRQRGNELGQELRVFGRGTQRAGGISLDGTMRGWAWGTSDGVERWGRNLVTAIIHSDEWYFLQVDFDSPGLPGEAHLSVGDSGGGLFILQDGLWCLAGINYAVDELFTAPNEGAGFTAAIFDARGYYVENEDKTFTPVTGTQPVPTSFYSTQIAARLTWIDGVIGSGSATLPTENFDDWEHAYFTPGQLADGTVSGPNADPDADGVPNLLEFAFNLDPGYAEPVVMTADSGLRGLPLIRVEPVAGAGTRLTVEFVRRTAASGAGLTYAVQFTASLDPVAVNWQTGGTESVTPINARWERVKVTDTVALGAALPARFARVSVTRAAPAPAASIHR